MMKKIFLILVGFLFFPIVGNGQDILSGEEEKDVVLRTNNNLLYFELFGNGLFYSFNYERKMIGFKNDLILTARIGLSSGYMLSGFEDNFFDPVFLPFLLNLRKENGNHFVLGVGCLFRYQTQKREFDQRLREPPSQLTVFPTMRVGYNISVYRRLFIEPAFTPFLEIERREVTPYFSGGLAVGYKF